MVDGLEGLLMDGSGLSGGLFVDVEERALSGDEESVIAVRGIGLDAYLIC